MPDWRCRVYKYVYDDKKEEGTTYTKPGIKFKIPFIIDIQTDPRKLIK